MMLAIYSVVFLIMLAGGLLFLREERTVISADEVAAVLCIAVFWPLTITVGVTVWLAVGLFEWIAKLLSKGE